MSVWIIVVVFIVLGLFLINLVLYFIQEKFIFHNQRLPQDYQFQFDNNFQELTLLTKDNARLNGVIFKREDTRGLLIYYHNHSENIQRWGNTAAYFLGYNLDVLVMDYRGYGKSTGDFDENMMFDDAQLWYDYISNDYEGRKIIIYGRGLGASFASYVASKNNVNCLILEAPMYNLMHTGEFLYPYLPFNILLKYNFDASESFKQIKCRSFLFHGKKDKVIPYTASVKLHELQPETSELILIDEGDHFNIMRMDAYLEKISEILE